MKKEDLILKVLNMLISSDETKEETNAEWSHPLKGKMVIVRARDAGVHFGELVHFEGRVVTLNKARRMHRWWAATEMTLSAVAKHGLNLEKELRICTEIDNHVIMDGCEIMPCSDVCIDSFSKVENYNEQ